MNTEIYKKLRLRHTDHIVGESYINSVAVFQFGNYYICQCNKIGEYTPGRYMIWHKDNLSGSHFMTEAFILKTPVAEVLLIIAQGPIKLDNAPNLLQTV